jgi:hypothetical protein
MGNCCLGRNQSNIIINSNFDVPVQKENINNSLMKWEIKIKAVIIQA